MATVSLHMRGACLQTHYTNISLEEPAQWHQNKGQTKKYQRQQSNRERQRERTNEYHRRTCKIILLAMHNNWKTSSYFMLTINRAHTPFTIFHLGKPRKVECWKYRLHWYITAKQGIKFIRELNSHLTVHGTAPRPPSFLPFCSSNNG